MPSLNGTALGLVECLITLVTVACKPRASGPQNTLIFSIESIQWTPGIFGLVLVPARADALAHMPHVQITQLRSFCLIKHGVAMAKAFLGGLVIWRLIDLLRLVFC